MVLTSSQRRQPLSLGETGITEQLVVRFIGIRLTCRSVSINGIGSSIDNEVASCRRVAASMPEMLLQPEMWTGRKQADRFRVPARRALAVLLDDVVSLGLKENTSSRGNGKLNSEYYGK